MDDFNGKTVLGIPTGHFLDLADDNIRVLSEQRLHFLLEGKPRGFKFDVFHNRFLSAIC